MAMRRECGEGGYELTPSERSFSKSLTTTSLGLTFAFSLFVPHHRQQCPCHITVFVPGKLTTL